ncbi:TetR/AcrR family transcriptional regulator [Streptomyces flaveolus]|uniref:TetR/AcrR family transcriptional regulator n=1 Tax=Streptomyces flaveolus TaxID=67297 RepID=UPI00167065E6|nr:TetR/AcrR family transcriptional regulator [Streptomyces flaveolus]GGQ96687.1 TetR family transcriptional regulator [Streptomyces flaveolus]
MTPRDRRLREQVRRHQLILATAREMAESEGWDSVTTRRLADRIEYSQPVLYQHFKNKDAIIRAVALEGFAELAAALRATRRQYTGDPQETLRELARAYVGFASRSPVLYQAMLVLDTGDDSDGPRTPAPLAEALAEIEEAVAPLAAGRDARVLTEVLWSAWHGMATLVDAGRLDAEPTGARLAMLTDQLTGPAAQLA